MIADMEDCTTDEVRDHIAYLKCTPVGGLANLLSSPDYALKKAIIDSVRYLGSMRTEFGELRPFRSITLYHREKFLVCQVLETLRRIKAPDPQTKRAIESVEYFMARDAVGRLEPELRITVLYDVCGYTIKDGCKRAVAFYEGRRSLENDKTAFPIYLITSR